ncbi:MAG: radical SAM protein [Patescibacteria group bacterium]|nr:radical SAM protein [Patescibacteria group bacterium]
MGTETSPCFFGVSNNSSIFEVSYELTNICNLRCLHCLNNSGNEDPEALSTGEIFKLIDDLKKINVTKIYLTGGEPSLHPDFDAIATYIKSKNIEIALASNGMDIANKISIIKKTVSNVSVSMDGIGETHDKFRNTQGSFDNLINSISLLRNNGVKVRISSMIWKENIGQLEQMIVLAKKMGVYRIHFSMLVSAGRAADNINKIALADDDYGTVIKQIHKLIEKYSGEDILVSVIRDKRIDCESNSCYGGERILHINTKGYIFPCSWVTKCSLANEYGSKWVAGNIDSCFKKSNLLQSLVKKRKSILDACGCPAMASHYYNDPLANDPLNKLLKNYHE